MNHTQNPFTANHFKQTAIFTAVCFLLSSHALANPLGLSIESGQVSVQQAQNLLEITNSPGAILNWQQFNIGAQDTTRFIQESASSHVVNRVLGGHASEILGRLESNGQVFLINPAGIVFGQHAQINTAGLLASTLSISQNDLENRRWKFTNLNSSSGGLVNQGSIKTSQGGSVVLIAPQLENSGIIHADGQVLLAAGHEVTLVDLRHPTLGLNVVAREGQQAVNLGEVLANHISVFGALIQNAGVVKATQAFEGEGGVIHFRANNQIDLANGSQIVADDAQGGAIHVQATQGDVRVQGLVSAQGLAGQGGEVVITGNRVMLQTGSQVNADGQQGGGSIAIGGGFAGKNESIQNAQQTVIQQGVEISANAIEAGNGGQLVVWSEQLTSVASTLEAKGGALSGNGGLVETSSKTKLLQTTPADTSAANGDNGTWLIDPPNIVVVSEGKLPKQEKLNRLSVGQMGERDFFSDFVGDDSNTYISTEDIVFGLERNGRVRLNAFSQVEGSGSNEPGNITISDPILISNRRLEGDSLNSRLILEAQGSVFINAEIGYSNNLIENDNLFVLGIHSQRGDIFLNAPVGLGATPQNAAFGLDLIVDVKRAVELNSQIDLGVQTTGNNLVTPFFRVSPFDSPLVPITNLPNRGLVFNPGFSSVSPIQTIDLIQESSGFSEFNAPLPFASDGLDLVVRGTTLNLASFSDGSLVENFEAPLGLDRQFAPVPVRLQLESANEGTSFGVLNTSRFYVNSIDVREGGVLRADSSFLVPRTFLFGEQVRTRTGGLITALDSEFAATDLQIDAGGLVNLGNVSAGVPPTNGNGYFGFVLNNGTLNVGGSGSEFQVEDLEMSGTLNLMPGQSLSGFLASARRVSMGSTAVINLFPGALLRLGVPSDSGFYNFSSSDLPTSSTGGALVGNVNPMNPAERSTIHLIGTSQATTTLDSSFSDLFPNRFASVSSDSLQILNPDVITRDLNTSESSFEDSFPPCFECINFNFSELGLSDKPIAVGRGALLDVTGLDSNLNTALSINVSGQDSQIFSLGSADNLPLTIGNQVIIHVDSNTPDNLPPNVLGALYIAANNPSVNNNRGDYQGLNNLAFNGQLRVNGGRVTLAGNQIDLANAVGINLNSAQLSLVGQYDNADVARVIRANSPILLSGILNNNTLAGVNVLSQGGLIAFNDLEIKGGRLQSDTETLEVTTDTLLQLNDVDASLPIHLNPQGYLYVDLNSTLNGSSISMAGDAGVVFATDSQGRRVVNDAVTFKSNAQGNLVLAGFRSTQSNAANVPSTMSLILGPQTRFEVDGQLQAEDSIRALQLFYESNIPQRSPFRVGTLTPDAVAVVEYDRQLDNTVIVSSLPDNTPYIFTEDIAEIQSMSLDCSLQFCLGVDPIQQVTFNSQIVSTLGNDTLLGSGIQIADQVGGNTSILRREMGANGEKITIGAGNFDFTPGVFNGVSEVVVDGTIRFGSNVGLADLPPNFLVNGQLIVDATATLGSGFRLASTGQLFNNGNLTFNGLAPTALQGSVSNNGSLNLAPGQILTFPGSLSGAGSLFNQGQLSFMSGISIQNSLNNSTGGGLNFAVGNYALSNTLSNSGFVSLDGSLNFANGAVFQQTGGMLLMRPGSLIQGNVNLVGGVGRILGQINGNLGVSAASFQPGNSPGVTMITGDLNLDANSQTVIEIQGNGQAAGVDFDFIQVGGTANLAGSLSVLDISSLTAQGRNPSVNPNGDRLTVPQRFTFLQAQSVNGQFSGFQLSPRDALFTFSAPSQLVSGNQVGVFVDALSVPVNDPPAVPQINQPPGVTFSLSNATNTASERELESAFLATNLMNSQLTAQLLQQPFNLLALPVQFESPDPLSALSLEEKEEVRKIAGDALFEKTPSAKTSLLEINTLRSNPIRPGDAGVCTP